MRIIKTVKWREFVFFVCNKSLTYLIILRIRFSFGKFPYEKYMSESLDFALYNESSSLLNNIY